MPLLEISDLDVAYGNAPALRSVSLSVEPKSIVSVLGANGGGKTTLLRTISGLLRPSRGRIAFEGSDIGAMPVHKIVRMGISHIPEGRGLLPELTVLENLRLGLYTRRSAEGLVQLEEMFSLFPVLYERRDEYAGLLSGGQQQMVAIARGLLAGPRLLMIDEFSLGLSPRITTELMQLLIGVRARGISVLLVEQSVHHALKVSDYVYLLVNGQIGFSGHPSELTGRSDLMSKYLGFTADAA